MAAMIAPEPLAGAASPDAAQPFDIRRPAGDGGPLPTPLVFASPHSGRHYPADMMAAAALDARAIRRSEDALVDELIGAAPQMGVPIIAARLARAYIDFNRDPSELDQKMFADELPASARARTARVAAGLGAIARVVSEGQEIYARKLTYAEARTRIEGAHRPYHEALAGLLAEARAAHGVGVLIDWHSMPSAAARQAGRDRAADIVLGDRFGAACASALTAKVETEFRALGYRVSRNAPYAGGYTTEHYGRPANHVHALQIEINRALYVNESTLAPTGGFPRLKRDIEAVTAALAAADWRALA